MLENKCLFCKVTGAVISAIAAVILAVTVTPVAYEWVKYLHIAIWIVTAISLFGAFIISMINAYNTNKRVSRMLKSNLVLLYVGAVGAIISTAVFTLLVKTGALTPFQLKFLTGIASFTAGLVMTAGMCFINGLVYGYCCKKITVTESRCDE